MNQIISAILRKLPSQSNSRISTIFVKYLKILLLALQGFTEDQCPLWASALTLYSLHSVVPIMALAFGVAKGFGYERILQDQLVQNIPSQEQNLRYIIDFAHKLLENTKGGVIAGIGIAFLLWSVLKVLGNIESSFNDIWKVPEARSLGQRFSDYLSMTLIAPILMIISSGVSVFISTQVTTIAENTKLLEALSPLILSSLRLLPYGLVWILLSFLYIFMPNTRVRFSSGVLAAIIAGTVYQLIQGGYIYFQVKISNYNAIYGSFAALPFFIIWLQVSWLIVLFGAEISFYHHHFPTSQHNYQYSQISHVWQKILALRVTHLLVMNFARGKTALSKTQIAQALDFPPPLTRDILEQLVESGIISRTVLKDDSELAYQPAKSIELLSVTYVVDALEQTGIREIPSTKIKEFAAFSNILSQFNEVLEHHPVNMLLKDISDTSI